MIKCKGGKKIQNNILKNGLIFGILFLFISSAFATSININRIKDFNKKETDHWALLIAVGVYAGHPDNDRPEMLTDVEDLHNMLLISNHWKEDHIKVIKGENATMWNIFKGFSWLNKMSDNDDFSLVYITTHGGQIKDKWPWDESDGRDEILVTYHGFQFPWVNIRDDNLNFMLSSLNAKGVCVVIDSCYAGGFNDTPYLSNPMRKNSISALEWMQEFAKDIQGQGRVVLMSCREDEVSYSFQYSRLFWLKHCRDIRMPMEMVYARLRKHLPILRKT